MKKIEIVSILLIFVILAACTSGCTTPTPQMTIQTTVPTTTPTQTTISTVSTPVKMDLTTPVTFGSRMKVVNITIKPSGDLVSGQTPSSASFTINFGSSGGYTFDSGNSLLMETDLEDAIWSYNSILDGIENPVKKEIGPNIRISGWELSYPSDRTISLKVKVVGTAPVVTTSAEKTIMRVRELHSSDTLVGTELVKKQMVISSESTTITAKTETPPQNTITITTTYTSDQYLKQQQPTVRYKQGDKIQKSINDTTYDKNNAWVIIQVNGDGSYTVGQIYFDLNENKWWKSDEELPKTKIVGVIERNYPELIGHLNWDDIPTKYTYNDCDGIIKYSWTQQSDCPSGVSSYQTGSYSSSGQSSYYSYNNAPKYKVGDIVGRAYGESMGDLIISYTSQTDRYTVQTVHFRNGQWVYLTWAPTSYDREFEEDYDPIMLGHINPQSVQPW